MKAIGTDISHHNGIFTNMGNIDFIISRACNGTTEDTEYKNNLPQVKTVSRRGAYTYYRTNHVEHPMMEQAELFLELSSGKGMKMLGVDYEISDYDDNVINTDTAIDLYGFLLYLHQERPNKRLLLYCSIYTWRDVLLPLAGSETKYGVIDWSIVDVWLPRYGWADDTYILELNGVPVLSLYDIWQRSKTGDGKKYGVESTYIDLNDFNGTPEEMDAWLDFSTNDETGGISEIDAVYDELRATNESLLALTNKVGDLTYKVGQCFADITTQAQIIEDQQQEIRWLKDAHNRQKETIQGIKGNVDDLYLEIANIGLSIGTLDKKMETQRDDIDCAHDLIDDHESGIAAAFDVIHKHKSEYYHEPRKSWLKRVWEHFFQRGTDQ